MMEWTNDEIQTLHNMLQQKHSTKFIAWKLGRTHNAVWNAMKKMMFQQLLYHDPSEVAANYKMSVDDLRNTVVDKKFYVPIKQHLIPQSVYMFLIVLVTAGITRFGHVLSHNWTN